MEYVTLNNGVKMPVLGYGVFQVHARDTERCVLDAIHTGYRLIDTAQAYKNEEGLGNAVKKSGVPREEIFLTTKIWITNETYNQTLLSIDESLKRLRADYIDLLLIHQPYGDYYGQYEAMEAAYKMGKARAIGVSNFYQPRFLEFAARQEIVPAVNQMEMHIFQQQTSLRQAMRRYGTQIEAWAPFAEGMGNYFENPVLKKIGEAHGKTAAQTALRFLIQEKAVAIPKTVRKEKMEENYQVFDFSLAREEMEEIESLDRGKTLFPSYYDDETGAWLRSEPNAEPGSDRTAYASGGYGNIPADK